MESFQARTRARSISGLETRIPRFAASCSRSWTSSAAVRYAFVGRQATFGQEPPQRSRSIIATPASCSRFALPAASRAAEPAPITIRSNCSGDMGDLLDRADVGAAPAARNARKLDSLDGFRKVRFAPELVAVWLEPQQDAQEEPRGAGRPRLWARRRRVLDGEARAPAPVAGEHLGQPIAEERRRL